MAGEGKGWISIYRILEDSWLWGDKPFARGQAWIDLLLQANHKDKKTFSKGELVNVKKGSFLTSDQLLADRWGWSRKKVRTFLNVLVEEQMVELKRSPKGTSLSIVKWDLYQCGGTTEEQQKNNGGYNRRTTEEQQKNTNNNDNNVNNVNNDNNVYERDELSHSALELCEYYSNLKPGQNITQHIDTLKIWIDMYGMEWTKEVLQMCVSSKGMFIKPWITKVLKDWKANGKLEPRAQEPKQYGKVSTFNDYTQRKYDYDDLEKKLLGWNKEDEQ